MPDHLGRNISFLQLSDLLKLIETQGVHYWAQSVHYWVIYLNMVPHRGTGKRAVYIGDELVPTPFLGGAE